MSSGAHDMKTELFWALLELKERLWLAWTIWGKQDIARQHRTLRLMEDALDLVQYPELLPLDELRTLLEQLSAAAPDGRLNSEIAAVKEMTLRDNERR